MWFIRPSNSLSQGDSCGHGERFLEASGEKMSKADRGGSMLKGLFLRLICIFAVYFTFPFVYITVIVSHSSLNEISGLTRLIK